VYELCEKGSSLNPASKSDLLFQRLICLVPEKFLIADLTPGPAAAPIRIGYESVPLTIPSIGFLAGAPVSPRMGWPLAYALSTLRRPALLVVLPHEGQPGIEG